MSFFKKVVSVLKKRLVNPANTHIVKPIDEHVVQPIEEYVINPIRNKVDHDFAIKDEVNDYQQAYDQFRRAYETYASDRSNYVIERVKYEKLSEEFEGDLADQNSDPNIPNYSEAPNVDTRKVSMKKFFGPDHLAKVVTGQTITGHFDRIVENQERITQQIQDLRKSTEYLQTNTREIRAGTRRLQMESARLQELYGASRTINDHILDTARQAAQKAMIRDLTSAGHAPATIAEWTGWSPDFIAAVLIQTKEPIA